MRYVRLTIAAVAAISAQESPDALIERGRFRQARSQLVKRHGESPANPRAAYLLARTLEAGGEYEAALRLMEGAVSADPGNADYHSLLAELCGYAAQKAGPFKGLSLARRFKKENEAALALNPKHVEALHAVTMFYWEAPGLIGGDKNKALRTAEELLRADPVHGRMTQAELALKQKNFAQAGQFYRQAVDANPKSYAARVALARFHLAPGRENYAEAETHARAAMILDRSRVEAYTLLARIFATAGRSSDLDAVLAQSIERIPDNLSPQFAAAQRMFSGKANLARAEVCLATYLSREPEYGAPPLDQARKLLSQIRAELKEANRK